MSRKTKKWRSKRTKQSEPDQRRPALISQIKAPAVRLALMIQYGQLFNEYRWFLFWRVFLGFSPVLADFLSKGMQNVIDKLSALTVPVEVAYLHNRVVSRVAGIHRHIVDQVTYSQAPSNPDFVDPYAAIMNRKWDEEASDAEAATSKLCSLLFMIWGNTEHQLTDLCGELSKFSDITRQDSIISQHEVVFHPDSPPFQSSPSTYEYQLWMAFHAGSIVDQLVRPTYPRLTSDHQLAVYQRVYFIQDHLEKMNKPDQAQQRAVLPVPLITLPDLPNANDELTDNDIIGFLCAFCQHYKLNDYSTAIKENLGKLQAANFSSRPDPADNTAQNDQNNRPTTLNQRNNINRLAENQLFTRLTSSKQLKSSIYRSTFKQLIYDQGFIPTQEDLRRFRNLAERLKLQLDIPDLRTLFPEMHLNGEQEIGGQKPVESLFDALIIAPQEANNLWGQGNSEPSQSCLSKC